MRILLRALPVGLALMLAAGSVFAAELLIRPRVYNDVPTAGIYMDASGSTATVQETNVSAPTGFANRDDFVVSENGVTPATFDTTDAFSFFVDVTLNADPVSPRKEAGILVSNGVTGNAQLIVNSDAKEIVVFGGGAPFWNAVAAGAAPYEVGSTVTLGMSYRQQGGMNGVEYTVIQGANTFTSGFKPWENNEQGIGLATTLGTYFQIVNDPNNPTNSGAARFTNIRYGRSLTALQPIDSTGRAIPEPGSLALLGTGLLTVVGLRRRK